MQRELTERLAKSLSKVSKACWEFAEGDRELDRKASGVHRKKTKRLVRRSSEVVTKLAG
ncbi:hypothetical protein BHE74_00030554, partial [Ensete ventricosum]